MKEQFKAELEQQQQKQLQQLWDQWQQQQRLRQERKTIREFHRQQRLFGQLQQQRLENQRLARLKEQRRLMMTQPIPKFNGNFTDTYTSLSFYSKIYFFSSVPTNVETFRLPEPKTTTSTIETTTVLPTAKRGSGSVSAVLSGLREASQFWQLLNRFCLHQWLDEAASAATIFAPTNEALETVDRYFTEKL